MVFEMEQLETFGSVTPAEALAAVRRAVRAEVLRQAKLGVSVASWKDGKVVWVTPAEVFAREVNSTLDRSERINS
jgi:hypothetical protein